MEQTDLYADVWAKRDSTEPVHKQQLVVLGAITEAITEQKQSLSPTAYFAALMTSLDAQKGGGEAELTVGACSYLLYIALGQVPAAVLRSKGELAASVLAAVLREYGGSALVTRHVLGCLPFVLQAQQPAFWQELASSSKKASAASPHCGRGFEALLAHLVEARPKVRRSAQRAVLQCLDQASSKLHASSKAGAHCTAVLGAAVARLRASDDAESLSAVMGMLNFLKLSLPALAPADALRTSTAALKVCRLNKQPHAVELALAAAASALRGASALNWSAEQLARQLSSLLHLPLDVAAGSDSASMYVEGLSRTQVLLHMKDEAVAAQLFDGTWQRCAASMHSDSGGASVQAAAEALSMMVSSAVGAASAATVVKCAEELLRYRHKQFWPTSLPVLSSLFNALGAESSAHCRDLIQSVAGLVLSAEVEDEYNTHLRSVLSAAIAAMGPTAFIAIVPINGLTTPALREQQAWLLPLLKSSIRSAPFDFFQTVVLPLDAQLAAAAENAQMVGTGADEINRLSQMSLSLWALLPALCSTRPTNVAASFKDLARVLGDCLTTKPHLRPMICSSLAALVAGCLEAHEEGADGAAEDVAALSAFARNFLPLFFNIYSDSANASVTDAIGSAISAYSQVADPRLVGTFFKTVLRRLLEAVSATEDDKTTRERHLMSDIALAMATSLDIESLDMLFRAVKPQLKHADGTLQKKSYKVLLHLVTMESTDASVYMTVAEAVAEAQEACLPASRQVRLRCIEALASVISEADVEGFARIFVGESVLATKEPNQKAREAGFNTLLALSARMAEVSRFPQMIAMLAGGLAGRSEHMLVASVGAIGKVLYAVGCDDLAEMLPGEFAVEILSAIVLLLSHTSMAVVKSALDFMKVAISAMGREVISQQLEPMCAGLLRHARDSNEFRLKVRVLFERLMVKLGEEAVASCVPDSQQKLLTNIRKTAESSRRKKKAAEARAFPTLQDGAGAEAAPDDLDVDDEPEAHTSRQRRKSSRAWLREDSAAGDAVDLLDSSAVQHVSYVDPRRRNQKQDDGAKFATATDGRIIIEDEEAAREAKAKRKRSEVEYVPDFAQVTRPERGMMYDESEEPEQPVSAKRSKAARGQDKRAGGGRAKKAAGAEHSAGEYRAKKAAGDVMKAGKLEPYAYMPLDRRALNKKRSVRGAASDNMTAAASRGGSKGSKGAKDKRRSGGKLKNR